MPLAKAAVRAEPGPNCASYTVEQKLDLVSLQRGLESEKVQRFKRAIRALRLEAPHTSVIVEHEKHGWIYEVEKRDSEQHEVEQEENREPNVSVSAASQPDTYCCLLKTPFHLT